jgi:hypothetical protein
LDVTTTIVALLDINYYQVSSALHLADQPIATFHTIDHLLKSQPLVANTPANKLSWWNRFLQFASKKEVGKGKG